ncbi:helix-turn-helix domain-containing protein [Streptomyces exfoliatus]|uniref:helix-turn-helix domain-containing protein n=1 Tax=Streptomyces vilmorinianum TaxID=3051092 RepID=UPI0010FB0B6C
MASPPAETSAPNGTPAAGSTSRTPSTVERGPERSKVRPPTTTNRTASRPGLRHEPVPQGRGRHEGEHLKPYRLAEARRLPATTDLPAGQVAAAAGFRSVSRFHGVFTDACGTSPAWFRHSRGL